MRRFTLMAHAARGVVLASLSGVLIVAGCAEHAGGPQQPVIGRFSVEPSFGRLRTGIVDIARGRFLLTRIPGGEIAADTVIDIAAGADSVDLAIRVPMLEAGETFNLTIRLISTVGDTVFEAGPLEVSPTTSSTPVPIDVPFEYVGIGAAAAGVSILTPDTSTLTGETVLLTGEALDSSQVPIPGTPIGWESLDPTRVQVTTDAEYRGLAIGGIERGVARIVATLVTGQMDTMLISNQPLPTTLVAESGNNQSARADSTLAQPLVARALAADGLGVSGLWVRFVIASGDGILSSDSVVTDDTGRAAVSFTLAHSFQPQIIHATTARLGSATAVFNATLIYEAPAVLEIVAGDGQTADAGSVVVVPPQVRVLDAGGLPIPNVPVTFSVTGGGGVVAGGTPVTDTLGLAAVTGWTLGTVVGTNTLQASVAALQVGFTATGIPGAPAALGFVVQPTNTEVGVVMTPPVLVEILDQHGNQRTQDVSTVVDIAITNGSGTAGATLSGTLTRTAVNGLVTFDDLSINFLGQGYTFNASIPSLVSVTSSVFDVVSGAFPGAQWLGVTTDWESISNWTTGRVPTNSDDVLIPAGSNQPILTANAVTRDLTVASGATVDVGAFTLVVGGAFTHAAGAVLQGSGVLDLSATSAVSLDGNLNPGSSPGLLTLVAPAAASLGASAVVNIELAGDATAGVDFDHLRVTNQILALGGTLNVSVIDPYVPVGTETWPLLAGVSGSFSQVILPPLDLPWTVYLQNDTLYLGPPPSAGPGINTWIATAGSWSNGANWSLGRAPIAGDTVELTQGAGYLVTLDVSPTIAQLTVGGTTSLITLDVGDQTLTITDAGVGAGLDILPLGAIQIGNGTLSVNRLTNNGSVQTTGVASLIATSITNAATWQVATGQLTVSHPTSFDFQTTGTLTVESGAAMVLGPSPNPNLSYQGGTIDGSGTLLLTAGTSFVFDANLTIDGLQVILNDAATVAGAGDRLTVGPQSILEFLSTTQFAESNTKIINQGTVVATGPNSYMNDSLYNEIGATVQVIGSGAGALLGTWGVDNAGTILLFGASEARFGPGSPTGQFITNRATGSIVLQNGAPRYLNGQLVNQGNVVVDAPTELARRTGQGADVAAQHVNSGSIDIMNGSLTVVMGGTSPSFTNDGTITVAAPQSLLVSNLSNGTVTNGATGIILGNGTVNLTSGSPSFANLGTIAPGLSPGLLTWAGNLPLGTSSTLEIELGGTAVGTEYDQLDASGFQVSLNGVLNVTIINGFQPADGDQFDVLRGTRTGQFTAVNLPTVPGMTLDTMSTSTDFFIIASTAVAPGPPGTETAWLGTADTDWTNSANWFGGNVPDDTTHTFIQAGTPFNPVIGGAVTAQTENLVLESGASVTVDGALTVHGDLDAGVTSIGGSGTLTLGGITGTMSGTLPRTIVAGNYTVVGPLNVNGDLTVDGLDSTDVTIPGTNLRLNGNKVVVAGNFNTATFGRLHMLNPADTLEVAGSATFNGDETVNSLTEGVLIVGGDFTQLGSIRAASFHPLGNHKTVLNGTVTQTVSFQTTASRLSTFANLEVTNATGVTYATEIVVLGQMNVVQPIVVQFPNRLIVDGPMMVNAASSFTAPYLEFGNTLGVTAANFTVDTVVTRGTTLPDTLPYSTVIIGSLGGTLGGSTSVGGNLIVQGVFTVGGQALVVNGDLVVSGGTLRMQSAADSLVVNGNATFNGAASPGFGLDAGVLDLKGNFEQIGTVGPGMGGNNFVAGGTHRTRFSGTGPQMITFSRPDSSVFNDLFITNTSQPVIMLSDAAAVGAVTVPLGATLQADTSGLTAFGNIDAGGSLTLEGLGVFGANLNANPSGYNVATTIFANGGIGIPDSLPYQNVSVNADASFIGNTVINQSLVVFGDPAGAIVQLTIGPFTVQAGQVVVQGTGFLDMADPAGVLDVLGSVLIDGESTNGTLSAGTLRVGGDFTQLNTMTALSFSADPGHITAFVGTGAQTVFFASGDTLQSHFGTLRIENASASGVQFATNTAAYGQLVSPSPAAGVERRLVGAPGIGLVTRGLDADSLILDGLMLAVGEGALITRFNAVRFENQDPTATQFYLRRKADAVSFSDFSFLTQPTTGLYLDLVDEDVTLPAFTVTMTNPNPFAHGGFARTDGLAQLIGWPDVLSTQILFAADSAGTAINSGIFKVDGDGANQLQVTTEGPPVELNVHPRWAPNRSAITYTARQPGDPNQLHIRSADGLNVFHLTSLTDTSTFFPRYSPNGVHLAFQCGDGGFPTTPQDVCVIGDVTNPVDGMGDGAGKTYVTDAVDATLGGSGAFAWNPQNPDQIAVVRDSVLGGPIGSMIWLINFDGSGRTPLGNRVILDSQGAPVQVYSMDWSPDGSFIAFDGTSGGTRSIFRIEVSTGVVTQLTTQNSDHTPVISPDNSEILFGRDNDLWVLMKIPATGGGEVIMTSNMNFDMSQGGWDWSPDGSEIVLTEDFTTTGVVISKILPTTTATSFLTDVKPVGRRGGIEIQDRQPSWRP